MHQQSSTFAVASRLAVTLTIAVVCLCASGCVMPTYKYGRCKDGTQPYSQEARNRVNRDSRRHPILDRMEVALHTPIEAVLEPVGLGNPDKRPRDVQMANTLDGTMTYLAENRLDDVIIDVRRCSPLTQWRRLRANRNIAPIWKYSVGTIYWGIETILPARLFRYSYYNPFTNTLAINSIWHEWNIYEAAKAKDFLGSRDAGAYATFLHIPFAPIYQEIRVGTDALTYARATGDRDLELKLYPFVYGEVFGGTVEEAAFLIPGLSSLHTAAGPLIWAGSFATGYAIGTAITKSGRIPWSS